MGILINSDKLNSDTSGLPLNESIQSIYLYNIYISLSIFTKAVKMFTVFFQLITALSHHQTFKIAAV